MKVKLKNICDVDWGDTSLTKSAYVPTGHFLGVSAAGCDGKMDYYNFPAYTPVISAIGANSGKLFLPEKPFVKQYYKERGEDRLWNVPRITRATDSRGKEMIPPSEETSHFNIIIKPEYSVGDTYSVQIEVDSSFSSDSYSIFWSIRGKEAVDFRNQKHFSITFSTAEIGQVVIINCKLITMNEWHRYYDCDDEMNLMFTVLPPKF